VALVEYTVADGVAHIQLNRPDAANAFNLETTQEFAAAVAKAGGHPGLRVVLVSGAGKRFCAGGDVSSFAAAEDQPAYIHQLAIELDAACRALSALEKPVIAAVHGAVAGAGLALMLSCDVVIAAPGTKFVFAYPGIGFTPDCGLSYLLPRAIGQQRALAFSLIGKPASASEALSWGMIAEVVEEPQAHAADFARTLADGPATALGQVRRLLRGGWEMDRVETGAEEARTITEMVKGAEAQSLITQFVTR
jgi:2-(1,2-epoxy-1,2-dihydrophenyl)acetyl-CoA isomerase